MMNPAKKHSWLVLAEIIDSLRIFPRLFLASCFVFTVWIVVFLLEWYTHHLTAPERTLEASGVGTFIVGQAFIFLSLVFNKYSSTSRDWNSAPPVQTSQTLLTTTTTTQPPGAPTP